MALNPAAQALLNELEATYKKAAQYYRNYSSYNLNGYTAEEDTALPGDTFAKNNLYIFVPAGAKIRVVTREEAYSVDAYGPDTDQLIGLWIDKFEHRYGIEKRDINEKLAKLKNR